MLSKTRNAASLALVGVLLGSCGIPGGGRPGPAGPQAPSGMVQDYPVKIGNPYQVGGVTYTPSDIPNYDEVGFASWYGEESGDMTANGENYNPAGVSAAHKILPLPSYVEVTALDTGRTILVRVNDRGPFANNRIIDLSRGAAEQLGIIAKGSAPVRVRRVNPPEQEKAILRSGRRAAERMEPPKPLLSILRMRLEGTQIPAARVQASQQPVASAAVVSPLSVNPASKAPPAPFASNAGKGGYFVQVGAFSSKDRAMATAQRIGAQVMQSGNLWRVRYGPYPNEAAARQGMAQAAGAGFNGAKIMLND